MKLLDRILLWALSVLAVVLGVLLMILVLFPSLTWLQVSGVRVTVGVLALLSILSAVLLHVRRRARKRGESALINAGENGSAYVTLNVIGDMARRIAQESEGVHSCQCAVKNNGDSVDLELEMALNPGVAVAPFAAVLQERLKNRIFALTGIRVGKVGIMVEAASEAKESMPAPADQLPGRVK